MERTLLSAAFDFDFDFDFVLDLDFALAQENRKVSANYPENSNTKPSNSPADVKRFYKCGFCGTLRPF